MSNEIVSGLDWFPTLVAAAGDTGIKDKLAKGMQIGSSSYKVHLDGYNILPYLEGKEPKSLRHEYYYFNDDGVLVAMRFDNWKLVFCEQRAPGNMLIWANPFTCLRAPKVYNLRMDPYERADITSDQYYDWIAKNAYLMAQGTMKAAAFLETFVVYPPRQRPASFSVDQIMENVMERIEKEKQKR